MINAANTEPPLVQIEKQEVIPAPQGKTYNIQGKEFPITHYVKIGSELYPLVDIPQMSDYKWQYEALMDRIKSPEKYEAHGEDVPATIERLKQWLIENRHKAVPSDLIYMPEKIAV